VNAITRMKKKTFKKFYNTGLEKHKGANMGTRNRTSKVTAKAMTVGGS